MSVAWYYWGDEPSVKESDGSSKNFYAKVDIHEWFMIETLQSWLGIPLLTWLVGKQIHATTRTAFVSLFVDS